MAMDRAALLGRIFPGVPADHRLSWVDGKANVPAAAASVAVSGGGTLGGTSFLFRCGAFPSGGRPYVHRLVGIGATLLDYQDSLVGNVTFAGAGVAQNLLALLGLAAATPFRHLRFSGPVAAHVLRTLAGPTPFQYFTAAGFDLHDGVIGLDWEIFSAAAGTVYVHCSRIPETRRFDLIVQPTLLRFNSANTVSEAKVADQGTLESMRPDAREDGAVEVNPIAGDGFEVATEDGGFGCLLRQVGGGTCPTSAVVHVRALVASYPRES